MADILHVLDIKAPIESVYALVATGEGISKWWTHDVASQAPNRLTIRFGAEWRVLLEKLETEPPTSVSWRVVEHDSDDWPGTDIVFRLSESDGWTVLEFDHAGWAEANGFFRFCSCKWAVFLLSIKQAAETGVGTPYPSEPKIGRND